MKSTMKRTLGLFAAALLTMSLALSVYASGHAPMPGDAAALEAFVNTADCTRSNGYMTTATFPETFVFTAPVPMSTRWPS